MSETSGSPEHMAPRVIRCPGCGGDSVYATSNAARPFCSERCRGADFGAWASENYRVAARQGHEADDADENAGG